VVINLHESFSDFKEQKEVQQNINKANNLSEIPVRDEEMHRTFNTMLEEIQ